MDSSRQPVTLFRPTGERELDLIREAGWRSFPPRLPEQPIFYPVLNEEHATQIARDWNTKDGGTRYEIRTVGSRVHQEYWIPAEDLEEFNRNLVGPIELVAEFRP